MTSNLIGLKKSNQTILNTRKINLNKFQIHVKWEVFYIKYLALMFANLIKK